MLIAGPGTTGAELILEQQRRQLELMKLPEAERAEKIALQKKIQEAVVSGKGLGRHAAADSEAGGHAVVPQPARIRSGGRRWRRSSSRS